MEMRLQQAVAARIDHRRRRLDGLTQMLAALSYQGVLKRGFALVRDENGHTIRSAAQVASGMRLAIELSDGMIDATADARAPTPATPEPPAQPVSAPATRPARRKSGGGEQGSLF
jgi:exodeoxyribonuclease VII large subunit